MAQSVRMVRVAVIDKRLKATYGSYLHRALNEALKGQRKGIWKIVDPEVRVPEEGIYKTREMLADRHEDGYMTRSAFRPVAGRGAMTVKDVFGTDPKGRAE